MSDICVRLVRFGDNYNPHICTSSDLEVEAAAAIDALREENARLREALAPFVDAGHLKVYISSASTKEECWVSINIKNRDLRAAAAAILEGVKNEN